MAQWIRAFVAFAKDKGFMSWNPYGGWQPLITSVSGGSTTFSGLSEHSINMIHTHIKTQF